MNGGGLMMWSVCASGGKGLRGERVADLF